MNERIPAFTEPSAAERMFSKAFGALLGLGLGRRHNFLLLVRGRRTGRVHATPVNVLQLRGKRFLVAGRGRTQWVRNAEMAGEVALRRGRWSQTFRARPVPDAEKPEILSAYLGRFRLTVQRYFPVRAGSVPAALADFVERYPVFELIPTSDPRDRALAPRPPRVDGHAAGEATGARSNTMEPSLRRWIGAAAVAGPALHLLSDALEWIGRGFSPAQLWLSYLGFVLVPVVMVGLYAVQRPRVPPGALLGAVVYGAAFVYFAHTALYALAERIADYATLVAGLGTAYTVHGALMIVGGLLFAIGSLRAGVLPRAAVITFLAGVSLGFVLGVFPGLAAAQAIASTLRNLGLIGMGLGLLGQRGTCPA